MHTLEYKDMEALTILRTAMLRSKVAIHTGGFPQEVYIVAINKVLQLKAEDEFQLVRPDKTSVRFKAQ